MLVNIKIEDQFYKISNDISSADESQISEQNENDEVSAVQFANQCQDGIYIVDNTQNTSFDFAQELEQKLANVDQKGQTERVDQQKFQKIRMNEKIDLNSKTKCFKKLKPKKGLHNYMIQNTSKKHETLFPLTSRFSLTNNLPQVQISRNSQQEEDNFYQRNDLFKGSVSQKNHKIAEFKKHKIEQLKKKIKQQKLNQQEKVKIKINRIYLTQSVPTTQHQTICNENQLSNGSGINQITYNFPGKTCNNKMYKHFIQRKDNKQQLKEGLVGNIYLEDGETSEVLDIYDTQDGDNQQNKCTQVRQRTTSTVQSFPDIINQNDKIVQSYGKCLIQDMHQKKQNRSSSSQNRYDYRYFKTKMRLNQLQSNIYVPLNFYQTVISQREQSKRKRQTQSCSKFFNFDDKQRDQQFMIYLQNQNNQNMREHKNNLRQIQSNKKS